MKPLTVRDYSAGESIAFADVDADGRADLLIGGSAGNVAYWRNTGTLAAPAFTQQTDQFAGFGLNEYARNPSLAVADVNGNGQSELLVIPRTGQKKVVQWSQLTQAGTLLDTLGTLGNVGIGVLAAAGDLTGDGLPDLVLGTPAGGLRYVRNTSERAALTVSEPTVPWAFPNPTDRYVTIRAPHAGRVEVIGMNGRRVRSGETVAAQTETRLDLGTLPGGVYLLRLVAEHRPTKVSRVVLVR